MTIQSLSLKSVYVAPRQDLDGEGEGDNIVDHAELWAITSAHAQDGEKVYIIRNLLSGIAMEVPDRRPSGAQVSTLR